MQGERGYLHLMSKVIHDGDRREGRNGVTRSLFGEQLRFNLASGFPLLTTKRVRFQDIVIELLWFLSGSTNVRPLQAQGVTIWDEWADEAGDLGPIYGKQWRAWPTGKVTHHPVAWASNGEVCEMEARPIVVDQIEQLVRGLKVDPYGRRHIVSAWNPVDIPSMALPPCHCLFQFHVSKGKLSCQLYQRSADLFLGVPYNIASYALLTQMVANVVGLELGDLIIAFGDVHLYENHLDQAHIQLTREVGSMPKVIIPTYGDLSHYRLEDFTLTDYRPRPAITAEVSV